MSTAYAVRRYSDEQLAASLIAQPPPGQTEWAARNIHWLEQCKSPGRRRGKRERAAAPLVLCGHGVSLRIERGTLVIRDGFTHHPQERTTYQFFKGDLDLPRRIVMLDGSGSLSFDVIAWLAEQRVTLISLDWRGDVVSVIGGAGFAGHPDTVRWQTETRADADARLGFSTDLIHRKIVGSIETLSAAIPPSDRRDVAIGRLRADLAGLDASPPATVTALRAVEARAGATYFAAWHGAPIRFKATARHPVPDAWRVIGPRSAVREGKVAKNERASHPLNALLNYAYAMLQANLTVTAIADGYDPTLGIMHHGYKGSSAYIFDVMEPERPKVDAVILRLALGETFSGADFTLRSDGVVRLGPQLARRVCGLVADVGR